MEESYIVFFAVIAAALLGMGLLGKAQERRRTAAFRRWLLESFGSLSDKEPEAERYAHIAGYYRKHRAQEGIDEITWNDLEMDRVYAQMNICRSAAGEEYLYALLHTPALCGARQALDEAQLRWFDGQAQERADLQLLFDKLGTTVKYSLCDSLDYLDGLGQRSNLKHYLALLLPAASVAAMFADVQVGVTCLIAALFWNLYSYFKEKNKIEPYLVCFRYLLRLMNCAQEMASALKKAGKTAARDGKLQGGAAAQDGIARGDAANVFAAESETLSRLVGAFRHFRFGAGLLLYDSAGAGGNPLDIVLDYLRMLLHLDILKFNSMLAEVWKRREQIDELVTTLGRLETEIAVASYRRALPYYALPQLREVTVPFGKAAGRTDGAVFSKNSEKSGAAGYEAQELFHPLLTNPVANSITADGCVLLTGSNASGKSTFLKSVALCALLSQTIRTAPAAAYRGAYYRIYSSMALRDNLQGGESYFIVEIKSLKRIIDAVSGEQCAAAPVLCFIDEVLRGTNTVERIAASAEILQSFAEMGAHCFAATHDIELTELLAARFDNYHFEETIENGDISFNYKLLSGKATTRNAIKLLEAIGYDEAIVRRAQARAERFAESGVWK